MDIEQAEYEFVERLKSYIDQRGVRALAAATGVTPAAVSQWRSGNLPSVGHAGSVAELVGDPQLLVLWLLAKGVPTTMATLALAAGHPDETRLHEYADRSSYRRLARMADQRDRQRTRQLHEFHYVGANRRPSRHRTRQILEADGELSEYFYAFDVGVRHHPPPEVRAILGCTVGLTNFEAGGMCSVELRLDEALNAGENHLIEYETLFEYQEMPPPQFRRDLGRLVDDLFVRVQFDTGSPPRFVYRSEWPAGSEQPTDVEELRLRAGVAQALFKPQSTVP